MNLSALDIERLYFTGISKNCETNLLVEAEPTNLCCMTKMTIRSFGTSEAVEFILVNVIPLEK